MQPRRDDKTPPFAPKSRQKSRPARPFLGQGAVAESLVSLGHVADCIPEIIECASRKQAFKAGQFFLLDTLDRSKYGWLPFEPDWEALSKAREVGLAELPRSSCSSELLSALNLNLPSNCGSISPKPRCQWPKHPRAQKSTAS
ncbi:MAG: hypothetical protein RBS40_08930 [Rhodocyclaceae bacterium]|jgi:hypothetical protein|nr:hypothetical protein [Rhodocyclaceae bacterium]